jgi:predicted amidohydrolase
MKIAAAQIACALGDLEANLLKMHEFASRAKDAGVELIVFPEMADTGYSMETIKTHATSWNEGAVPHLRRMAKRLSMAILSAVSERVDACIYNSQIFVDAHGDILAKYRKTHLFSPAPIEEDKCFTCGNELTSVATADFRMGLSICYDLRFPEVYRALAVKNNANVFVISSAWPFPRVEHLRTLTLARAIENQSYVILANRVGTDDGVTFCGSSAIVDPYGVVIASASADREELLQAELSEAVVASVRNQMPVFDHRRRDLYGNN